MRPTPQGGQPDATSRHPAPGLRAHPGGNHLFGYAPASRGAQDATPEASPVAAEIGPGPDDYRGIERIDLGHGRLAELLDQQVRLSRATIAPNATPPVPNQSNVAADASFVLYVESGSLVAAFARPASEGGYMEVRRQAAQDQTAPRPDRLGPNQEVTLEAGDSVFVENALYIFRNPGGEETVVLTATVERAARPRGCPCPRLP